MEKLSIKVDLRIFPIDIVYAAAYVFLDDAYVFLDEGEENQVIIEMQSKNGNLEGLEERFNEELLNYVVYNLISKKNEKIRQACIQRILLTNGFELQNDKNK